MIQENRTTKTATKSTPKPKNFEVTEPFRFHKSAAPDLYLTSVSRLARKTAKALLVVLVLAIAALVFLPWQQTLVSQGTVINYAPNSRPQTMVAPIKGRIINWNPAIVENSKIQAGTVICEIQDLDSDFMSRLEEQVRFSERSILVLTEQASAARRNLTANEESKKALERQLNVYKSVIEDIESGAEALVLMAKQKISAEENKVVELEATKALAQADFDRQKILYEEKIISFAKFQDYEAKLKEVSAKLEVAKANVRAANEELESKIRDKGTKVQKAQGEIEYAESSLNKAQADVEKAKGEISKIESELAKANQDLLDKQSKLARQQNQKIISPMDGQIVDINPILGGQILKEGDDICSIVPSGADRAAELWLNGRDTPLVQPGMDVRLQFEGWPAIQFTGWPSVAKGTFGGTVISVDAATDANGKTRILVSPTTEEPWPENTNLLPGSRVNGWVLANRVPLWFEIWRNLNGFPPSYDGSDKAKDSKKEKIPKIKS